MALYDLIASTGTSGKPGGALKLLLLISTELVELISAELLGLILAMGCCCGLAAAGLVLVEVVVVPVVDVLLVVVPRAAFSA